AAFSGLGWFEDPVYSSMLERSEVGLARLIFHELTHKTVWIPDQVALNENLAEFVAQELVAMLLTLRGDDKALERFRMQLADEKRMMAWVRDLRGALRSLYRTLGDAPESVKAARKAEVFRRFLTERRPQFELKRDPIAAYEWNNASVLSFGLYGMEVDVI